jgi:hypothetical protein
MEAWYPMLEEEYDKDNRTRYIEGLVTIIVFFCTLILVLDVWKHNKHFCMSL